MRTETWASLTADADNFHLEGRVEAFEGDQKVSDRPFRESVPRRHV